MGTASVSPFDHLPGLDAKLFYQIDDGFGWPKRIQLVKHPNDPSNERAPEAQAGEAWCRVWIPERTEVISETVCVKPAQTRKVWIPPVYGTRPKLVCVQEAELTVPTTDDEAAPEESTPTDTEASDSEDDTAKGDG